jgi:hypothetical protein
MRYAIDVPMPLATGILASRAGVVIGVIESYVDGDNTYGHEHWVLVRHDDNTVGACAHLTNMGAVVEEGEAVTQGALIGSSGHTSNSTEPHLHLDVRPACLGAQPCTVLPTETVALSFNNAQPSRRDMSRGQRAAMSLYGLAAVIIRVLLSLRIVAALCVASVAHANPLVQLSEGMTTPIAGARVETFDDRQSARYAGAGRTMIGSHPESKAPEGDRTPYYSVKPVAAAFVAEPGISYNYFGLYWGTIDEYNELRFLRGGRLIATVTGRDVLRSLAERGTASPGLLSCYVNIYFGAQAYTRIEFRTSALSFESDNHAFANVTTSEADAM